MLIAPSIAGANETLSFLGVSFGGPVVSRVRIVNGNFMLGPGIPDLNGNPFDLVVMDDFLYGEPFRAPVPEPASWALMIAGFGLLGARFRRAMRPARA